jgi:hypothetical protein
MIATLLWRACRPSGFQFANGSFIWWLFSSEWIGALIVIAVWPIAVPCVIWSYRRSRGQRRFIRDDEPWPPDKNENA